MIKSLFHLEKNVKLSKDTKTCSLEQLIARAVKHMVVGYHLRSLVEAKMHCIIGKNLPSQVNQMHARVAVLNKLI